MNGGWSDGVFWTEVMIEILVLAETDKKKFQIFGTESIVVLARRNMVSGIGLVRLAL